VGHGTVAHLVVATAAAAASLGVIVVLLHLAVHPVVFIVAAGPVEGGVIVGPELSYGGQRG